MRQPFYRFQNEAGDDPAASELLIFAPIGDWEDMGEISAQAFSRDLKALPKSVKRLDIHINSPGGSLTEAQAIYSRLADHPSHKNVYIDGIAASAASIIAMVGHKIFVRSNATIMIHAPTGIVIGSADDMRKMAGAIDTLTEGILNVYAKRTGLQRDELRAMVAQETWMDADTAVAKGFADEVRGVVKAAASLGNKLAVFNGVEFDLSRFHNIQAFRAQQTQPQTEGNTPMTATDSPTEPAPAKSPQPTTNPPPSPGTTPPPPGTTDPPKPQDGETVAADAVAKERQRVTALMELDRPSTHAIVQAAIKDGKQVQDVVSECMAAMDKSVANSARRVDASTLDVIPASDAGIGGEGQDFGKRIASFVKDKMRGRRSPVLNGHN